MTSAAPQRRFVGGWLSMAPESESQPVAGPSTTSASDAVASSSSTTLDSQPKPSHPPHRRRKSSRESSRPRKAVFHLDEGDAPTEANTPGSSSRSRDSSASMMSPVFDVRASFAPMVFNKRPSAAIPTTTTAAARAVLDSSSSVHQRSAQSDVTAVAASSSTAALSAAAASHPPHSSSKRPHSNLHHIEDDGAGLEYAGRKWKGKTAHAVEQELEQEGDTTIMSYSPDAVYLASRLEGLRRNLEAAGDEARGRKWIGWTAEEEEEEVVEELDKTTLSSRASPVDRSAAMSPMVISPPALDQESSHLKDQAPASIPVIREDRQPATLPTHVSDLIPRPSPPTVRFVPPRLDPQAKAAALDSRVELRLLRRSDLEQVRELHCLHGDDNEKVDAEHYATSAAFLLRLLVDENHVCVVAVAKPLPIPEQPFMTDSSKLHGHHHHRHNLSPRPPPPSMDMPPSSAAYVFASQGLTSDSPLLQPVDFKDKNETRGRRKTGRGPASSLGRHSPILGAMSEEEDSEAGEEDAAADSSLDLDEEEDVGSDVADQDEDEEAELSDSASPFGTSPAGPQRSQSLAVPSALRGRGSSGGLRVGSASSSSSISRLSPLAAAASTEPSQPSSLSSSLGGSGVPAPRTYTTMPTTTVADSTTLEDSPSHQHPSHLIPLAGPTNEVAPPRALRVMIPPPPGVTLERETILGVASASISIKPATESLWGWEADSASKRPKKEIHILTLAVSSAERGLGLGGRLLDRVVEEGKVRSVGSAYRAQMGRRVGRSGSIPPMPSTDLEAVTTTAETATTEDLTQTRTYLEVHPSSLHAQSLYLHRGFKQVRRLHGFYRGDPRIPAKDRSLPGGGDALLFEREEEVEEEEEGEVK